MKRINVYIREDQLDYLENDPTSIAEHYRRALDLYIQGLKKLDVSASTSPRKEPYEER